MIEAQLLRNVTVAGEPFRGTNQGKYRIADIVVVVCREIVWEINHNRVLLFHNLHSVVATIFELIIGRIVKKAFGIRNRERIHNILPVDNHNKALLRSDVRKATRALIFFDGLRASQLTLRTEKILQLLGGKRVNIAVVLSG